MRLAFSTNAYTRFALPEALTRIRDAGFSAVEILADRPHAYPEQMTAGMATELADQLSRLGMSVSNINANCTFGYWRDPPPEAFFEPSLISPNPQHRQDRLHLIGRTLEFARQLGAPNISITSGRLLGGMPPAKAAGQFEDSIRRVLDLADRAGVNVGIECEPGLYVEYAAELAEWIVRIGHPRLGANLDIGHSVVAGENIRDVTQLLAGRIWNLHIEDIPGRKHYHMIPGQGTLDWAGLKTDLQAIRYDRFATVELYTCSADPDEAARQSHQFLSPIFQ